MIQVIVDNPAFPPSAVILPAGPVPLDKDGAVKEEYYVEDWRDLSGLQWPSTSSSAMFADSTLTLHDTQIDISNAIANYPSSNLEYWIISATSLIERADWKAGDSLSVISQAVDYYLGKAISVLSGSSAAHDAVTIMLNGIIVSSQPATEGQIIGIRDYSAMWAAVTLESADRISDFRTVLALKMETLGKFIATSAELSALAKNALWQVIQELKQKIGELESRIANLLDQIEELKNQKTSLYDLVKNTIGDAMDKIGEGLPDFPDPQDWEKYIKYALIAAGLFLGIKVVGLFK